MKISLEKATLTNKNYRKVLQTTKNMQLVLMCIVDEIPEETHPHTSQFIRVEKGVAKVTIDGQVKKLKDGDACIVPPGAKHRVQNAGPEELKLYTIYTPPEHADGLIQKKRPE